MILYHICIKIRSFWQFCMNKVQKLYSVRIVGGNTSRIYKIRQVIQRKISTCRVSFVMSSIDFNVTTKGSERGVFEGIYYNPYYKKKDRVKRESVFQINITFRSDTFSKSVSIVTISRLKCLAIEY